MKHPRKQEGAALFIVIHIHGIPVLQPLQLLSQRRRRHVRSLKRYEGGLLTTDGMIAKEGEFYE